MFNLRGVKLFQVFLVISVCLVSLTTFPSSGYCEGHWVLIRETELFSSYYNLPSVYIDKQNQILTVWTKKVFTEKGKNDWLTKVNNIGKQKYNDINRILYLSSYNYREWKKTLNSVKGYSNSNYLLYSEDFQEKWEEIKPNNIDVDDTFLKKLLKDNHIQR